MYVTRVPGRATSPTTRARRAWVITAPALALALAACGADQSPDIDEAAGSFPVQIVRAAFPPQQEVSRTADLMLTVRNTGDRALPQLAVTVWTGDAGLQEPKPDGSFSVLPPGAGAGTPSRSVWVLEPGFPKALEQGADLEDIASAADGGARAAQTDTFTFGPLPRGASRTLVWRVTAVRAGRFAVNYALAAGLGGRAKAVDDAGAVPVGKLRTEIVGSPAGCVVTADGSTGCDD